MRIFTPFRQSDLIDGIRDKQLRLQVDDGICRVLVQYWLTRLVVDSKRYPTPRSRLRYFLANSQGLATLHLIHTRLAEVTEKLTSIVQDRNTFVRSNIDFLKESAALDDDESDQELNDGIYDNVDLSVKFIEKAMHIVRTALPDNYELIAEGSLFPVEGAFLRTLRQTCKSGGRYMMSIRNEEDQLGHALGMYRKSVFPRDHLYFFEPNGGELIATLPTAYKLLPNLFNLNYQEYKTFSIYSV